MFFLGIHCLFSIISVLFWQAPRKIIQEALKEDIDKSLVNRLKDSRWQIATNLYLTGAAMITSALAYLVQILYATGLLMEIFGPIMEEEAETVVFHMLWTAMVLDSITNDICVGSIACIWPGHRRADQTLQDVHEAFLHVHRAAQDCIAIEKQEYELFKDAESRLQLLPMDNKRETLLAGMEVAIRRLAGVSDCHWAPLVDELQRRFQYFQAEVRLEIARLEHLMHEVISKYQHMQSRWHALLEVREELDEELQQPVRGNWDEEAYLDHVMAEAETVEPLFFEEMEMLVREFNAANMAEDVGLSKDQWPFQLRRAERKLEKGDGYEPSCVLVRGPRKLRSRAEQKAKECYADALPPAAASVLDYVRVEVRFDEPYQIAVFTALLRKRMNVVQQANGFLPKLAEELTDGSPGSIYRYVVLNLTYSAGSPEVTHVVEVQLALKDLAMLRDWQGKPRRVIGMKTYLELLEQPGLYARDVKPDTGKALKNTPALLALKNGTYESQQSGGATPDRLALPAPGASGGPSRDEEFARLNAGSALGASSVPSTMPPSRDEGFSRPMASRGSPAASTPSTSRQEPEPAPAPSQSRSRSEPDPPPNPDSAVTVDNPQQNPRNCGPNPITNWAPSCAPTCSPEDGMPVETVQSQRPGRNQHAV
eukprot:gnl/TRDRNA2_/TRDRNA2_73870_c0_seq1.p1 gnl/TRDRNA2_/TRDRNA2_73870_c0~~gnl/TRDRNA2_/TRDRNA2_73870_c0_seq1.p1  ORF type:complete len:762 (+),score=137.59 gnl/TRDRNA2_/TRDRNA2_73870_c0_seq1:333-2288(+)